METVTYFTDVALRLSSLISALFALHVSVALAALGWAISGRTRPRGPGLTAVLVVAAGLTLFFFVSVASLDKIYGMVNAALEIPKAYWASQNIPETSQDLFFPFGRSASNSGSFLLSDWKFFVIPVDAIVVIGVCLLLSDLGRRKAEV